MVNLKLLELLSGYDHYMVDVETTGKKPDRHGISSLACTHFNPADSAIFAELHLRCNILHRSVDPATMEWRKKHNVDQMESMIPSPINEPHTMIDILTEFMNRYVHEKPVLVWAKPTTFDIPFLQSYYDEFSSVDTPWKYYNVMDVSSFIRSQGMEKKECEEAVKVKIATVVENLAHDARFDNFFQIKMVAHAINAD